MNFLKNFSGARAVGKPPLSQHIIAVAGAAGRVLCDAPHPATALAD